MTRRRATIGRLLASTCLLACAVTPAAAQSAAAADPLAPRFSARADIVLVDVTVVDERGRPVTDLTAADFSVSVAGRSRPLQSVQFVNSLTANKASGPEGPRDPGTTTNTRSNSGRLLLIVADEANLRFGASRAVLRSAEGLLSRLAPGDLVGVSRFPGGGGVEFTSDRARVIDALGKVTGQLRPAAGRTARVHLGEAADFDAGARSEWPAALERECGPETPGQQYEICNDLMEAAARELLQEESARSRETIGRLEALVSGLTAAQAPVNVVFISETLFVGRETGLLSRLAALAATARVSLSVIRPAPDMFQASERGAPPGQHLDDAYRQGLEMLAGQLRGGFYVVSGNGASAFDRLSTELSGYYLLGITPTDEDRTGRERRLRVDVTREGLSLRARPNFVIREDTTAAPLDATMQLQRALAAPLPAPGLPIKVATYAMTNSDDDRIRLLIAAEIGEAVAKPTNPQVGVLILNDKGQVVTSSAGAVLLSPAIPASSSPGLFFTSTVLEPGDYTLRLAAVDAVGSVGSVHHAVAARLRPLPGGLEMSDLVVAPAPAPGEPPRVSPSAIIADQHLAIVLEGRLADAARLARLAIRFEVAQGQRGPAVVKATGASQSSPGDTRRVFSGVLPLGAIPAGEYQLRAVITDEGGRETTMVRPFRLEGEPAKRTAAGAPTASSGVPLPMPDLTAPRLAFTVADVLRPDLVRTFIDGLQKRHPASAALQPVVDQARAGVFPAGGASASPKDGATVSFVNGLAALRDGKLPQATALFQQTLKAAPTFIGVAFYLGACHAARGEDREAIGAWQMSLLSEGADAVYPMLVDALLRVGDNKKALEFIEESPASWGLPTDRMRREAIAYAVTGRYDEAAPLVTSLLDGEPDNTGLLFLGLQLLYRAHLDTGLSETERARFRTWADRYEILKGPEAGLVMAWKAWLER